MNATLPSQSLYELPRQPPTLLSSNTSGNGRQTKRRRATTSGAKPTLPIVPPLPTPTSATHPTANYSGSNRLPSPRPFTPPSSNSTRNNNTLSSMSVSGLNLPFSPNFSFSPLPRSLSLAPTPTLAPADPHKPPPPPAPSAHQTDENSSALDPMLSMPTPYDQPTPGAASTSGGSVHTDPDKDPFLSLLEQLAENEVSRGGPSELDFFLSGQSG
jgi:hypothetical protein